MLIRRLLNLTGSIGLIILFNLIANLQINFPIIHLKIFYIIGLFYLSYLIKNYKNKIVYLLKLFTINKKNVLLLESISCFGILFFLSKDLSSSLLTTDHLFNKLFYKFSDNLIFYLTLLSGIILAITQKSPIQRITKSLNKQLIFIILLIFIFLGGFLRFYKLGAENIKGDEFQVISAATGYLNTGDYYSWDWIKKDIACENCFYKRAWPHTWMVAQSYNLFGISETSSRLPSVILGVLTILVTFLFTYYFSGNHSISLIVAGLVTIGGSFISLSRYTRMYVLLIPIFMILLYTIYRSLTEEIPNYLIKHIQKLPKKIAIYIKTYLNFNWPILIFALVILYYNFQTHINSLVALPAVALFIIYLFITENKKRYLYPVVAIFLVGLAINLFINSETIYFVNFITPFSIRNTEYFNHILDYPFFWKLTLIFNLISFIFALYIRNLKLIYLYFILGFGLIFFVYIADRYPSYVYSSHLVILATIGSIDGFFKFWKAIKSKKIKIFLTILSISTILIKIVEIDTNRYDGQGSAQHSIAYQEIIDNYDYDKDLLLMQYGRTYYLQNFEKIEIFSLGRNRSISLREVLEYIEKNKKQDSQIWFTWESAKTGHLSTEILKYVEANFEKIHGSGVDDTEVEVFYEKNF